MKLAVITNILTPYRAPLFEALRQRVTNFKVLVMAEGEDNRQWRLEEARFTTEVLPGVHVKTNGREVAWHVNYGVMRSLQRFDPDVVLSGGFAPANLAALAYCTLRRRPFVCWGELTRRDVTAGSALRRGLRRWMIARSNGAIASSSEARETFRLFGMEDTRILLSVMPIDVERFHERALAFRNSPACHELRSGFPGPILLSVGRLVRSKGWPELFDIFERVHAVRPDVSLVVVGEGSERASYEAMVRKKGWRQVCFTGFLQQEQLALFLAATDVFVFPTLYDPFGAVLSEAMAAELPVVSSVHAAATRDLVADGLTGFVIDPTSVDGASAAVLRALALSAGERAAIGGAAYGHVARFGIEPAADAMVQFLEWLVGAGGPAAEGVPVSRPAQRAGGACG
jgi:glycosyltransferase involved in cell wall biosynthesis